MNHYLIVFIDFNVFIFDDTNIVKDNMPSKYVSKSIFSVFIS